MNNIAPGVFQNKIPGIFNPLKTSAYITCFHTKSSAKCRVRDEAPDVKALDVIMRCLIKAQ
jgi:hypothetical protein